MTWDGTPLLFLFSPTKLGIGRYKGVGHELDIPIAIVRQPASRSCARRGVCGNDSWKSICKLSCLPGKTGKNISNFPIQVWFTKLGDSYRLASSQHCSNRTRRVDTRFPSLRVGLVPPSVLKALGIGTQTHIPSHR